METQVVVIIGAGGIGIPNSMVAYIVSKQANHVRVQAESIKWGERGARVNSISPALLQPLWHSMN